LWIQPGTPLPEQVGKEKIRMSEQHNEFHIIVNGRPKKVPGPSISFEQVVALAFNPIPLNAFFTVTWSHGNHGGSLTPGKSVDLQNGMKFDVTETGQS
jgi:Multiubiquitin